MRVSRVFWCVLAYTFTGLGLAGIVVPLLPTTPFLLLAVWAAAKGSPRLQRWLLTHPKLGPYLVAWRNERAIPRRAKYIACLLLVLSWIIVWLGGAPVWLLTGLVMLFCGVGFFILTRPDAGTLAYSKYRSGKAEVTQQKRLGQ